jgi:hypothetical protein
MSLINSKSEGSAATINHHYGAELANFNIQVCPAQVFHAYALGGKLAQRICAALHHAYAVKIAIFHRTIGFIYMGIGAA